MDESALYSGVDNEPNTGTFGNEVVPEQTKEILDNQKRILKELTPQLEALIAMIDNERKDVIEAVADFIDNSTSSEESNISEIKAAARYRRYLDNLKTKFVLALQETKKK